MTDLFFESYAFSLRWKKRQNFEDFSNEKLVYCSNMNKFNEKKTKENN